MWPRHFRFGRDGYLTRRRRMVDGVALLVDVGGEAALSGLLF